MSFDGFSPGPRRVTPGRGSRHRVRDGDGKHVATFSKLEDAQLDAAAPVLLAALREAYRQLETLEGVIDKQTWDEHRKHDLDMPDDAELHIVLQARHERCLTRAVHVLASALRQLPGEEP